MHRLSFMMQYSKFVLFEYRILCCIVVQAGWTVGLYESEFNDFVHSNFFSILRKAAESKVEESLSDAMADVLEEGSESILEERPLRLPGTVCE